MREKKKKQISCLLLVLLAVIFLQSTPVFAVNEGENPDSSEIQIAFYLIPKGPDGEKAGDFWIYAEFLDAEKQSVFQENWTVSFTVTNENLGVNTDSGMEPWQNQGYIHNTVQLTPEEGGYGNYKIHLKAENEEGIQAESEAAVPDILLPWPALTSKEWRKEVKPGQENLSYSFAFDWKDTALFSRLFTVKTEQIPENVEVEKDEEHHAWVMHVEHSAKGTMNVILSDVVGDAETIPYEIAVAEKSFGPLVAVILAGVVFVLVLAAVILTKKGHSGKKERTVGNVGKDECLKPLLDKRKELNEVYDNLKDALLQWTRNQKDYLNFLKNNEEFIRKIENCQICTEVAEEETARVMPEHLKTAYENAWKKIIDYTDHYDTYLKEWSTKEVQDFINNTIGDLGDEIVKIQEKSENLQKSKAYLLEQIRQQKKQKEEMERPLGMRLKMKFTVDGKSYVISRRAADRGFLVDEQRPLEISRGSRQSSSNMETILGERTELRVSARNGKTILLENHGHGLYEGADTVEFKELGIGSSLTLTWQGKGSKNPVCIEITTF